MTGDDADELTTPRVIRVLAAFNLRTPRIEDRESSRPPGGRRAWIDAAEVDEPTHPESAIVVSFAVNDGLSHRRSSSISERAKAMSGPARREDFSTPP